MGTTPSQQNRPTSGERDEDFDMNGHDRVHTLYSGTNIIRADKLSGGAPSGKGAKTCADLVYSHEGPVAMVVLTGPATTRGALISDILFAKEERSQRGPARDVGGTLRLVLVSVILPRIWPGFLRRLCS